MGNKNKNEFQVRAWDDSIGHTILLDIINANRKYLGYGPMNRQLYDRVFASIPDPTQDVAIIQNPEGQIVGFAALHKPKVSKSLVCWDAMYPEYFQSSLPQLIIEQAITMGRRKNLPNLKYATNGPLCEPIDNALENLGFKPNQIAVELHLTDFDRPQFTESLSRIEFSNKKKIKEFDQYVFVYNEAYRSRFDYLELTIERAIQSEKHNRAMGELEYIFAFKEDKLAGYCELIFHAEDSFGHIMGLAVLPKHQQGGIGRELLARAIKRLHQQGSKWIKLVTWTDEDNTQDLYTNLGFTLQEDYTTRVYNILNGDT